MKLLKKLNISGQVLKAIIFKKKIPLVVGWNITYRCNLRCQYCEYPSRKSEELNTDETLSLIDKTASLGTKIIVLSGGEPLLREDLGVIVEYCRNKDIYVVINSNGTLVKKEFKKIKKANMIQLSLDGPEDTNDITRGKGVYDKVLEAVKICKDEHMQVSLTTVISKYNISSMPYMLDLAKKHDFEICFQPVGNRFSGSSNSYENMAFNIGPQKDDYQKVIAYLIEEKSRGNKFINNSLAGLKHFRHWPGTLMKNCVANLISCSIEPDGTIFTCDMFPDYQKYLIPSCKNFKNSFESLELPQSCTGQCNGPMLELNLLRNFQVGAMLGMWKRFKD